LRRRPPGSGHGPGPDPQIGSGGLNWLHRWTVSAGRPIRREPEPPAWIVAAWQAAS